MIHFDLDTLEFSLFCDTLKRHYVSAFSVSALSGLRPAESASQALAFQKELGCIFNILSKNSFSVINDNGFYDFFNRAVSAEMLSFSVEPEEYEYLRQFLLQADAVKTFIKGKNATAQATQAIQPLLKYIDNIVPDMELADTIGRTFETNGDIKDNATVTLYNIRRKLLDVKKRIQSVLQSTFNRSGADKFIQEQVVVLRNGRYTIPCKTNFNQYIQGIVHDKSASGQTVYVEPVSCIPINNDMQESILAEQQEIARILDEMLKRFIAYIPELKVLVKNYTDLVFRLETAIFYDKYEYCMPQFGERVYFKDVHHPLLKINKSTKSIGIDVRFEKDIKLAVITGPNTGGKTASLKSVGLNHIIAMCGFPVFGKHAEVMFFTDVLADIGDKQSLSMDLSTFSSHMTNIKEIMASIGERALVLFDELGTGTDPKEGAALAKSVLEYLREKSALVMVTTHFAEIKAYAYGRIDAVMYAVDYDYDTFAPRYRLLEGVAGSSEPVLIAQRLGFPDEVISNARSIIAGMKTEADMLLEEINLMKAEAEHTKRALKEREEDLLRKEARFEEARQELDSKLAKKELELLEDTFALLQKGKRLASEKAKASTEEITEDIKKVDEKIAKIKQKRPTIADVRVGDTIFLERYNKIGKILSLDSTTAFVDLEGMKVKIKKQDLVGKKLTQDKPKPVKLTARVESGQRRELVIVGKRVEEGLDILDKFIDDSLLAGYDKVYVIHGRGSGQLRNAVQDFLRTCGRVKSYETASNEEGGSAVTVVTL